MQLASFPKMQGGGTLTYFGASSARQQSKFGKIVSPLRLQMPNYKSEKLPSPFR
jgi:hypothetical protein